jgi:hypothetical protein
MNIMKNLLVLFLVFNGLANVLLSAQNDSTEFRNKQLNPSPIYFGVGGTFPLGVVLTTGAFGRQGWGGSISFNATWRPAKNLPNNYDSGKGLFGEGRDNIDNDNMQTFSVRVIKQFPTNSKNIIVGLEAGPSYVVTKIADQFIPTPNPCTVDPFFGFTFCKANYTYQRENINSLGWSMKGKIRINRPQCELGLYANLNRK